MKIKLDSNFPEFQKLLDKRIKKNGDEGAINFLKELSFLFLQLVIPRTPMDTGRARAGWYPALNKLGGSGVGQGEGDIKTQFKGTNKYIEIFNRVEYIVLLEYGRSKQAPKGMARVSLQEIKRIVKKLTK